MSISATRTITPIDGTNGRFEWYAYNEDLRIIHSVEDDMFHAGSIVRALGSMKVVKDWLRNKQTAELLSGFESIGEFSHRHLFDEKPQFNNIKCIRGTYIHRLLVNHFAMWISPRYAYKISIILDDHFEMKRKVDELKNTNKTLMQKVDELIVKNDELLQINRSQKEQLNRMEHKQNKTNARLKVLDGVPKRIDTNISSGNTPENVYIYSEPDECDEDELVIHLAARTDQTLKKIVSDNHIVYAHYKVGNAKDHVREIYNEAHLYGIVNESHKSHQITIDVANLKTFKDAITSVCRKLNAPSNILNNVLNKIQIDNNIDDMKTGWEIDNTVIKDICKKHQITVEQLCKIYNGNATHIRNGKHYNIALSSDNSCLLYARQIGNSIKYYPIKDNRFEFN